MSKKVKLYYFVSLAVASVYITSCNRHYNLISANTSRAVLEINEGTVPTDDSVAYLIINPYKLAIDSQMNVILAYSERQMVKEQPEGRLNNFVADVILTVAQQHYKPSDGAQVQICLLNNGGLRSSFPKGAITKRNVYELMPFENKIVIVTLTGDKVLMLFNYVAATGGVPIAGAALGISGDTATNILVGGKAFDPAKTYKVVTSDYLAEGGDEYEFFSKPVDYEILDLKIREAIIEYLISETSAGRTIDANFDKRVYYE